MATFIMDNSVCPIHWECKSIQERILQNGKNLLMTRTWEVPYDRKRGISREVEHKPLPYVAQRIRQEMDRVFAWEPDIELKDVKISQETDELRIECKVEVPESPEGRVRIRL